MLTTHPFDDDKLHEECGVFGITGAENAAALVAQGLHALQHRGQEAAGITSFDGTLFHSRRAMGLVGENFSQKNHAQLAMLRGSEACGHVRYATTGETALNNVQPLQAHLASGGFAVAHNGNISNFFQIKERLVREGAIFTTTSDTEAIMHLIARSDCNGLVARIVDALEQIEGAYSLVCLSDDGVIACRDPRGIRPLVMGRRGDATIFASETVALDITGAEFVRSVEPGELIVARGTDVRSYRPFAPADPKPCIFEYVYFSRPDSHSENRSIYSVRKAIGRELARESTPDVDIVVPVPDSGVAAAIGFAQESNVPFELGIIRAHHVGRTFIQPTDEIRHEGVRMKHNANRHVVAGKRIVLIDDSIVRGTTSRKIVQMMRDAGALEVHMRVASPPTRHPCYYGVDTPEEAHLMAANMDVEQMRKHINADSLAFISMDGLYKAMGEPGRGANSSHCDACFSGDYPTPLTDRSNRVAQRVLFEDAAE